MIIFISYGIGGAEALNPVYNLANHFGIPTLNVAISNHAKNKLDNCIKVEEDNIFNFIEEIKPTIVINERSSGLKTQNEITRFCKEKGIFNCAVLDLPGNYIEKFSQKPDLIFVPSLEDKDNMLDLGFEKDKVYISGNPSFDNLPYLNKKRVLDKIKVLFISQPLLKYRVHNEFEIFDRFFIHLEENFKSFKVDVKLHPYDDLDSWKKFIEKGYRANIINDVDYEKYDLVIGYNSTILYRCSYMNIPTIFYNDMEEQITTYKHGLDLSSPATSFRDNATENIFNYLLNFV